MDTPHEDSPGPGRRVTAILATVGFAFVIVAGGGSAVYYAWARMIDVVLAGVVLLLWAAVALLRPRWRSTSVMAPGLALVAATFALSALLSRSPRIGLEYAAYAGILGALYLLFRELLADRFIRARILAAVPALCGVLAVAYIAIVVADWLAWWEALGRFAPPPLRPRTEGLTYANPSTVMAMLMLLFASSAAFLGTAGRRGAMVAGLAVLALAASFLTGSRGGLIGLGAAVGGVLVVGLVLDRRAIAARLRRQSRTLRALAIPVGAGVASVGAIFGPELVARLTASGSDLRVSFAMASLRQFVESPITGAGPGLWPVNRLAYSLADDRDRYIPHAHNIVLQTLAELGVVGVVVGAVVAVIVVRIVLAGLRGTDPVQRRWGYASVFALAYLAGHQQVDLFANSPAVILAGAIPIAMIDANLGARGQDRRLDRARWSAAVTWATVLAIGMPWLVSVEQRAVRYEAAVRLTDVGEWEGSIAVLRESAAVEPDVSPYQSSLGLAESRVGDLAAAAAAFERAASFDDYPPSWINLAAVSLRMGQAESARVALEQAMRLGRQHPAVAFAAGELWLLLGERTHAIEAFAQALVLVPSLGGDEAWRSRPELSDVFDEVMAAAYALAPPSVAWELATSSGEYTHARSLVPSLAAWERLPAGLVLDALTGEPDAFAAAWEYFDAAPQSPYTWTWGPRIAEAAGEPERAQRYRAQVVAVHSFGEITGRTVRIEEGSASGTLVVNESNIFHGLYAYRRPLTNVQFVPWLSQLAWR